MTHGQSSRERGSACPSRCPDSCCPTLLYRGPGGRASFPHPTCCFQSRAVRSRGAGRPARVSLLPDTSLFVQLQVGQPLWQKQLWWAGADPARAGWHSAPLKRNICPLSVGRRPPTAHGPRAQEHAAAPAVSRPALTSACQGNNDFHFDQLVWRVGQSTPVQQHNTETINSARHVFLWTATLLFFLLFHDGIRWLLSHTAGDTRPTHTESWGSQPVVPP